MTGRFNKVQTGMNSVIDHLHPVDPVLLLQVRVEPRLDVVEDRLPALFVVDKVSVTGRVDDRQAQADSILLNVCAAHTLAFSGGEGEEGRTHQR